MDAAKRIVINTAVQYIRSAIYMILTLISTRYILLALGQSDFGLYSVIGSIITLLGFITTSLAGSTQRFLSVTHGKNNPNELKAVFANAVFIHIGLAVLLVALMVTLSPLILHSLRIPEGREDAGRFVYYMVTMMIAMSFVTSPIRALFIARENIIFVSVVEVTDAILRLAGAIALMYIDYDSLRLYAILMAAISVLNLLIYILYAGTHYPECHLPRWKEITRNQIAQLTGFAVWNIYGVGATIVRTQGIAIVINRFFGTLVNAAYGIALQVSNATSFIATSILSSINPQLMKAEGAHDRERMLHLSTMESRYSFMLMSLLLIPICIEMPAVLSFWLSTVPPYATLFCRCLLMAFVIDQITIGLTSANQAEGHIRNYNLLIGTLRIAILPLAYLAMRYAPQPQWIMCIYIVIETVCGICRLPFLHHTTGLKIGPYCRTVLLQNLLPIAGNLVVCLCLVYGCHFPYRWVLTFFLGMGIGGLLIWNTTLTTQEKQWIKTNVILKMKRSCK